MYMARIFCVDSLQIKSVNIFVSSSLLARNLSSVGPRNIVLVAALASARREVIFDKEWE